MAYHCNPSYSGRDGKSRPAQAKSSRDPISINKNWLRGACLVTPATQEA
jgi:hypothetical protein